MTREQAIKFKTEIEAFINGKGIQYKNCFGEWVDVDDPVFDIWTEYRVKPDFEPYAGQEVLVSDDGITWENRIFAIKKDNKYHCLVLNKSQSNIKDKFTVNRPWDVDDYPSVSICDWNYCKKIIV